MPSLRYPAVEAFEAYAEAIEGYAPQRAEAVVNALVTHHRAFYTQLTADAPGLNTSRWGFARHEDGMAGIEWLLDAAGGAQGGAPDSAFLWELAQLLHNESDAIMAGVPASLGGGYTWLQWFVSGDPFSAHDDGEPTGESGPLLLCFSVPTSLRMSGRTHPRSPSQVPRTS